MAVSNTPAQYVTSKITAVKSLIIGVSWIQIEICREETNYLARLVI
jgi:hypothetical protein